MKEVFLKITINFAARALLSGVLACCGTATAGQMAGGHAAELGGITIRLSQFPSRAVTLKNGEYREPVAPGSATEMIVKLTDKRAFGKVNGREAAAIIIINDAGGSGTFSDLALLLKRPVGWVNIDTVLLGDRVMVHDVSIKKDEILVTLKAHGPGDALCCPTKEQTIRFRVISDHLVAQKD